MYVFRCVRLNFFLDLKIVFESCKVMLYLKFNGSKKKERVFWLVLKVNVGYEEFLMEM